MRRVRLRTDLPWARLHSDPWGRGDRGPLKHPRATATGAILPTLTHHTPVAVSNVMVGHASSLREFFSAAARQKSQTQAPSEIARVDQSRLPLRLFSGKMCAQVCAGVFRGCVTRHKMWAKSLILFWWAQKDSNL